MAAIFPDKRTRSQLTLPDNLLDNLHLDRSPLKDARTRMRAEPPASTIPDAAESHDEASKKRAASPSLRANEYASSAADFPAAKRLRTEGGDIEGDYENTATNLLKSSSDARLATEASHKAPSSSSSSPDNRAQPVPAVPRIDLQNHVGNGQHSRPPFVFKRLPTSIPRIDLRNHVPKQQHFLFEYKRLPTSEEPSNVVVPPRLPVEGILVSGSKKSVKAGASKKKPAIPRVSRGALEQKEQQAEKAGQAPRSTMAWKKALISAAQASQKAEELSPLSDSEESGDAPVASTSTLRVPQTPAKLPSFAKPTQSSLAKTPVALRSPVKAAFGSPSKLPIFTTLATRPTKTHAFQTDAKLQRSVEHDSALNKAGPSSARSNGAPSTQAGRQLSLADFIDYKIDPRTGKRIYAGNIKPIFAHRATCKASQKTPLAAVPGSPVKGDTSVVDLCEDVTYQGENRERLVLLRARTKDDELKAILDNTLYRREASPEVEEPMKRVSTAEAFDNLRQAVGPATPPRRGLRPHSALATYRPAEGDAEEFPSDDEDVDDGDLIDDKNYHGASKKKGGLTVLSHVRAFVDVRDSHTSRDSGEAFVAFLEMLGAKVCKKLTKTCTHIVFKNGSFNTVATWKAAEPKPLVVRLSWVTECVSKTAYVVEDEHLLDISDLFPSGIDPKIKVAKRHSFDESWELSMDSSLKPLEIARQRG